MSERPNFVEIGPGEVVKFDTMADARTFGEYLAKRQELENPVLLDACRQYRKAVCDDRDPDPLSCDALERALASSRIAYARDLVLAEAYKAGGRR